MSWLFALQLSRSAAAFAVVFDTFAWLAYTVFMHGRYGQTIGKMVMKVRVVDSQTEGRISWRQAWLREGIPLALSSAVGLYVVVGILDGRVPIGSATTAESIARDPAVRWLLVLPALWFVVEVMTMLTNERRRALHDLIAGTVVIRTNAEECAS